jgi:RNA polymerase sigma-70 factor (ECF subfamily)
MSESREQFVEQAMADYEAPLIGYAYGFVHDLDRARDVVQDTFIRLCRQDVEKVRDGLKGWLFTVCRNRALDMLRKESRLTSLDEPGHAEHALAAEGPDERADMDERIEQLMSYLDRLPENQKTVILMKFRDGLSYREIAEGTLEFTASDGTVTTLGQGDLADLPKWVPRYPGAENEVVVYQRGEGPQVRGLLSFSSTDSPAVVGDFYEARMKDLGSHHGSSHTNLSFGSTSQSKRAISVDGKEIRLTATASSESDPTRVQVIYEGR